MSGPESAKSMEITAAAFAAHLRCPTKGWLVRAGEVPTDEFWLSIRARVTDAYRAKAALGRVVPLADAAAPIDADATVWDTNKPMGPARRRAAGVPNEVFPILYSPGERHEKSDELLVAFAALAAAQGLRCPASTTGRIVYGEQFRLKRIDIAPLLSKARNVLDAIKALAESPTQPTPVLNEHCPACEYQSRCRGIAIQRDDLSLLGAITQKERTKFIDKGITTITQLSYGYRPRRRRRPKSTPRRAELQARHDHKLKALALKKGKIHVVGAPVVLPMVTRSSSMSRARRTAASIIWWAFATVVQGSPCIGHSGPTAPRAKAKCGGNVSASSVSSKTHSCSITAHTRAAFSGR
jgi:CRISPR/Cas system-associated exonuclease Cas4 (RecB family)